MDDSTKICEGFEKLYKEAAAAAEGEFLGNKKNILMNYLAIQESIPFQNYFKNLIVGLIKEDLLEKNLFFKKEKADDNLINIIITNIQNEEKKNVIEQKEKIINKNIQDEEAETIVQQKEQNIININNDKKEQSNLINDININNQKNSKSEIDNKSNRNIEEGSSIQGNSQSNEDKNSQNNLKFKKNNSENFTKKKKKIEYFIK